MPNRAVVCVATTGAYQKGQLRLAQALGNQKSVNPGIGLMYHELERDRDFSKWPSHRERPYAFKAYALYEASKTDFTTLLWADACMLPVQDMSSLWERIERDGYWFSRNGWSNYEWTADSAYPDLFPEMDIKYAREMNRNIPHVVATCFGISLAHELGRAFLEQYYRLASETTAFCGPWINEKFARAAMPNADLSAPIQSGRVAVCGEIDVRGHRHDQTAASVIAWRLGMKLTDPPEIFAYGKAGEQHDLRTIMIADGSY